MQVLLKKGKKTKTNIKYNNVIIKAHICFCSVITAHSLSVGWHGDKHKTHKYKYLRMNRQLAPNLTTTCYK